jgi:hypothetical protein
MEASRSQDVNTRRGARCTAAQSGFSAARGAEHTSSVWKGERIMRAASLFTTAALVVGSWASFAGADPRGPNPDGAVINPNAPVFTGSSGPGPDATLVAPVGVESSLESGLNTAIRSAPRTYQEYMAASNFSSITQPSLITGMRLRLAIGENWRPVGYVGSTWPSQNLTLGTYTVTLSKPSAQLVSDGEYLSTTPTFASYQDTPVTVYNQALNVAANSFVADGGAAGVHSYSGPNIVFTTPYSYTPGNGLVLQINHQGYTPSTELNAFFASRSFQNGVTDAISSTASGTAANPNGFSSPYFVEFTYVPIPEPTSLGGLAAVGALALRRRKA